MQLSYEHSVTERCTAGTLYNRLLLNSTYSMCINHNHIRHMSDALGFNLFLCSAYVLSVCIVQLFICKTIFFSATFGIERLKEVKLIKLFERDFIYFKIKTITTWNNNVSVGKRESVITICCKKYAGVFGKITRSFD